MAYPIDNIPQTKEIGDKFLNTEYDAIIASILELIKNLGLVAGSFVPAVAPGSALPTGEGITAGKAMILQEGTYTQSSGNIVVEPNHVVIAVYDGTSWAADADLELNADLSSYLNRSDLELLGSVDIAPYLQNNKAITTQGVVVPGNGYASFVEVPIQGSTRYTIYGIKNPIAASSKSYVQLDTNKNIIAGTAGPITSYPHVFTSHANARFLSFTAKEPSETDSDSITNAILYKPSITNDPEVVSVNGYKIIDEVSRNKIITLSDPTSVVNLSEYLQDNTALQTSGAIIPGASGYKTVVYAPIRPNVKYVLYGLRNPILYTAKNIAIYNDNGQVIVGYNKNIGIYPYFFTAPSDAAFVSFTVKEPSETDNFSEQNVMLSNVTSKIAGAMVIPESKWAGKTFVSFGDSITWYDGRVYNTSNVENPKIAVGYVSYMRNLLRCNVDNQGASGYDMPGIRTIIRGYANYANVQAATITSGANDHRKAVPIGTLQPIGGTFTVTTFLGALQDSVEYILNQNPNIRIYLMTPIIGYYNESGTVDVPGPYKGEPVLSVDYVNAIKSVGELYNLPVCDWYHTVGINSINRPVFIGDKEDIPYYLHPTLSGYKRMADVLIPFLNNF
ncbi:hypothetical protein FKG96_10060 [Olivibacter sp. LS-1]|uniref:SGNH/GDSL hydrolase family protein n=1 Tax=Olivibacter sp. LS-1 TaxID=2592345 RepID=UPI0011EB0BF7|nr:SGNH/GDSL hydrolase family protein [Olivibacter sp. LS-1]QEL01138.1 hypothetical protein FKG96_10060 [Olivibacter sp. LS-1]